MKSDGYDSGFFARLLNSDYAFAVWRRPNSKDIESVYCHKNEIVECQQIQDNFDGFVFAPFEWSADCPIFILPDKQEVSLTDMSHRQHKGLEMAGHCATRESYIHKLGLLLQRIGSEMPKVVLSRCQWFSQFRMPDGPLLFGTLCDEYPEAFVYQVYIPQIGYWSGASPELLFSANGNVGSTVALAGTQPACNVNWSQKEKTEQQLVARHIREVLKNNNVEFRQSETYTAKTGPLAHLRTDFDLDISNIRGRVGAFVASLHPTPAICGLPVSMARQALKEIEGYSRQYYSGFVGPISQSESMLYVNIRCFQAFDDGMLIYAGGGITADSNPENEWVETELKLANLLRFIKK